ncbi:TadE/TadG family type IV pilus assembly protein [Notoacmeibacter sp. MSK16QG-6]|uniref:TadE/TadG family type IV pilus assembly protein n=1 Tax=Notoacmeibacter sp. MSK16QG-6 TaxID=2957982 RepID=UPI0020A00D9E|nr:TadE/TadG family type IV pilus assembly protein [Notoacmeibacter sp. MSK16QG-6]MCP1198772.1 pilus assembly protein [Notoacmeibacter sp. MSK16QG-6]
MDLKQNSSGRWRCLPKRFLRHRSGATAVEFSFLLIPFLVLVFSIIEVSLGFAAGQLLANGSEKVVRKIRTGQQTVVTDDWVKTQICDTLSLLAGNNCKNEISVYLQNQGSFSAAASASQISLLGDGSIDTAGWGVSVGGSSTIHTLKTVYPRPTMIDLLSLVAPNAKMEFFYTSTWRNEPY